MLIKKITTKLGYALASLVLLTAQMTPFFVFGGRAGAVSDQMNQVSDWCTTGVKFDKDDTVLNAGENIIGPITIFITTDDEQELDDVTSVSGDKVTPTKIIVNGANEDNVYDLPADLPPYTTLTGQEISHVIVCYETIETTVELKKMLNPADDSGVFDLYLNGDLVANRVVDNGGNGATSGAIVIPSDENFIIKEKAGNTSVSLIDYATSIECRNQNQILIESGTSSATTVRSLTVSAEKIEPGDQIVCLFINTRIQVEANYCDPSQRPAGMSIGEWLSANQVDGSECFDYEVTNTCGYFNVAFTKNLTGLNYEFRYVIGATTPEVVDWEGDGTLPKSFTEDFNGGSVELTYYVVGPESEYFEGFGIPNVWDGNGAKVTVDTDCEEPPKGSITIVKDAQPDSEQDFDFRLIPNGDMNNQVVFSLDDNGDNNDDLSNKKTFDELEYGTYRIQERNLDDLAVAGWQLTAVNCEGGDQSVIINVSAGREITLAAGEHITCTFVNEYKPVKILATKIVCDDEMLLPNWGTGNGENITSLTAIDWVTENSGCALAEGWNFEYALNNTSNPGDNVEIGGTGWTPFGPTNNDGETSVEIKDVSDVNRIWVREQLKDGYLGFTYNIAGNNNDDVSAELYCNRDVLNYDNFDFIDRPQLGNSYYCVAWNVKEAVIRVHKEVVNNENGTKQAEDFEFTVNGEDEQNFAEEGEYVELSVKNGEYTIEEVPVDGYTVTYDGCENIAAVAGKTYNCYVKNEAGVNPPVVIIDKTVLGDCDECVSDQVFYFHVYNNGSNYSGKVGFDETGNYSTGEGLKSGTVKVEEYETDGWKLVNANCYYYMELEYDYRTYSENFYDDKVYVGTEFTAENGVTYYCEFYNEKDDEEEEEFGEIVVTKFNDLNNNGAWDEDEPTLEGWEINVEGQDSKVTDGDGTATFSGLAFDNYVVTETMQDGWVQTVNNCDTTEAGVTVDSEETVECYIGNYKTPSTPGVLGTSTTVTPPAVLAATGDSQSSYMFVTGLTLIAATIVTSVNRKKVTVSAK